SALRTTTASSTISTRALGEAVNRFPRAARGPLPGRRAHCPPSRARVLMAAVVAGDFELLNQLPKLRGHLCQLLGGLLGFCHTGRSIIRCLRDTGDVVCNLSGSLGCLRHVAGHLVRRGALLLDRGGDNARDVIDLVDHATDASDCLYRALCVFLNSCDFLADIFGSFGGLVGEFLDLIRYDRKTFTRLSSPGGFGGDSLKILVDLVGSSRDDVRLC